MKQLSCYATNLYKQTVVFVYMYRRFRKFEKGTKLALTGIDLGSSPGRLSRDDPSVI